MLRVGGWFGVAKLHTGSIWLLRARGSDGFQGFEGSESLGF